MLYDGSLSGVLVASEYAANPAAARARVARGRPCEKPPGGAASAEVARLNVRFRHHGLCIRKLTRSATRRNAAVHDTVVGLVNEIASRGKVLAVAKACNAGTTASNGKRRGQQPLLRIKHVSRPAKESLAVTPEMHLVLAGARLTSGVSALGQEFS